MVLNRKTKQIETTLAAKKNYPLATIFSGYIETTLVIKLGELENLWPWPWLPENPPKKKGYLPGLVICDIAIENGTFSSLIYLLKMGDFP